MKKHYLQFFMYIKKNKKKDNINCRYNNNDIFNNRKERRYSFLYVSKKCVFFSYWQPLSKQIRPIIFCLQKICERQYSFYFLSIFSFSFTALTRQILMVRYSDIIKIMRFFLNVTCNSGPTRMIYQCKSRHHGCKIFQKRINKSLYCSLDPSRLTWLLIEIGQFVKELRCHRHTHRHL